MKKKATVKKQKNEFKSINSAKKYNHVHLSLHDLDEKIKNETAGLKGAALGEKKLEIICPIAHDFLLLINADGSQDALNPEPILKHSFRVWILRHECIQRAYQILADECLITEKDRNTPLCITLEVLYANVIHFVSRHATKPNIVPSKDKADKVYTSMRQLKKRLQDFQGVYCSIEMKQHLLQCLLDDILSDQDEYVRSIYSSGVSRDLTRAILTKRIIEFLYRTFLKKDLHPRLVARIASEMISVFFNPMDISDATDHAEKIKTNLAENDKFRMQTIDAYLTQDLIKGAE